MEASFRPSVSFLFLFLAFLFLPNFFFFFCTGLLSELRCVDTERQALLNFKQHLIDSSNRLSSWTAHGDCCHWGGVVCHNLTGHVQELHLRTFYPGDSATEEQYEAYGRSMFGGKLNPSLLDLKHLNYFDLSFNDFSASPIPPFLGSMKSLTSLNLSNAGFVGLIPHQLGNLSNLLFLNLESYWIGGLYVNNLEWLSGLPLLQHLDMSYVNLSKVSDWVQLTNTLPSLLDLRLHYCQLPFIPLVVDVHNMTSLRHLDLSENNFNSSIPNWLYSFSRLEFLNLQYSNLQGTISSAIGNLTSAISIDLSSNELGGKLPRSLGNLCNLREIKLSSNKWSQEISEILESLSGCLSDRLEILDLSSSQLHGHLTDELGVFKNLVKLSFEDNSISGPLPVCLGKLSSLRMLNLGKNQFKGTLPQNLGQLSKLEVLYIYSNVLKGVVSEVLFANLTSLRSLDAGGNQLTLKASQNWIPPFQLETLSLQSWNLGPKFPQWLCSQRRMLSLDISYTQISDMAPPSFWNLSSQFQHLNLSHNLINGEIPNSPVILSASVIDLSSNHFKGSLPCISSNVYMLDLSNNSFSRSISHFFCFRVNEPKNMEHLNLEKNLLSGKIPDCLMNWNNLEVLNLGNNNFSGSIPASMGSLTNLHSLHLYNNKFSEKLPSSLKNCERLVIIDVVENRFAGNIPSWIGHRCTSLMILSLRSNYFHGHIPKELCALTSLQILDLSHNKLYGSIPRCVKNFSAMATNNISNHHLNSYNDSYYYGETLPLESALLVIKGNILEYSTILQLVKSIDFSKNNLSGEIPKEVTSLQGLQSLNLSYNFLIGSILENIGTMGSLESIDFSLNQLSGQIPSSMSSLTFLNHLNLSNNKLTGKIPLSTQLQSLNPSSFVGNKLCGPPLTVNCTTNGVKPNNENIRSKATGGLEVDWFYVSMALGFVVGFWSVCGNLLLNKQWRIMYFQFLDHLGYKLKGVVSLIFKTGWFIFKSHGYACKGPILKEPRTLWAH
ncbi:receptor-like protein EIX2 isoform X1 [Quercus suber]|uniref:receptor-like protein EIX2 isoform X1 n=1 Tax=Quercus suber TaxID=58331 RepID=UPI0032DEA92E